MELKNLLMIKESDFPCVRIIQTTFSLVTAQKYKLPGELSYSFYGLFLREFRTGKIHPYLKVEELGQEKIGEVRLLNAYTFQSNIMVSGQDSVVLYHRNLERDSKS